MGLSERRIKQRIGVDPRNLSWSEDKTRFSYKHMTALGWKEQSGIGGSGLSGNPNHIAVVRKLDSSGIGMARAKKEGEDQAAGAGPAGRGLEDVLKRLAAAASPSSSPTPESSALIPVQADAAERRIARNRIASRQKHLHSKRLASSSSAALAEILGVPVTSLPSTASPSPATATASSPAANDLTSPPSTARSQSTSSVPVRDSEEVISTSTISVSDYFRQKLREKMLARQAAAASTGCSSGSQTPPTVSEGSLAVFKEEVKGIISGFDREGSRVAFGEDTSDAIAESSASPSISFTTPAPSISGDASSDVSLSKAGRKAARLLRRQGKEAHRAAKEAKRAVKEAKRPRAATVDDVTAGSTKKRKREVASAGTSEVSGSEIKRERAKGSGKREDAVS